MFDRIINKILYNILSPTLYAKYNKIKIGENCRIVTKNWGSEPYLIEIGNHVHITKGVEFVTHDGSVWVFREEISDLDVFGKIIIYDNTYIGNNSTILPGVIIGTNCIIGAKSVVTKSIPDNSVVAGVPARYIMSTSEFKEKIIKYNAKTKNLNSFQKREVLLSKDFSKFISKPFMKFEK